MRSAVVIAILSAAVLGAAVVGVSMAWSKKLYLFSAVNGVVVHGGEPVAGAEVERTYTWAWKDVTRTDATRTDDAGTFHFDAVVESSLLGSVLPHEPVVTQKIFIRHGGSEHKAWMYTKHNYDENGELGGRPIELTCRLEAEPSFKGDVFGIGELEE